MLIVFLAVSLFSACSSADANSKKEKTKKSKTKKDADTEEETEDSEEETAESHSNGNKENEKSKNEDKKSDQDKKEEKTSEKDHKAEAEAIWADLVKGNKRFMSGKHTTVNYSAARISLTKGQQPKAIILGCADSRVSPEFIFDKNLGELFVIREAGNIADEVSLGSIEYAVEHLHAKLLVVLGHESCGAVAATVSGKEMPTKNLREIVETIAPAFKDSKTCIIGNELNNSCIELNVQHSSEDVVSKSPIIKEAVEKGELTIIRGVYKMETGEVIRLN